MQATPWSVCCNVCGVSAAAYSNIAIFAPAFILSPPEVSGDTFLVTMINQEEEALEQEYNHEEGTKQLSMIHSSGFRMDWTSHFVKKLNLINPPHSKPLNFCN